MARFSFDSRTKRVRLPSINRQTISSTPIMNIGKPSAYSTDLGSAYCGDARDLLACLPDNSVSLVMTSPPFALQRQKEYGNKAQEEYVDWLIEFARIVHAKLKDDGSFVIDLGGAYRKGLPVRSLHQFRALIRFCDELGFHLAEEFFWHNPSKLPSPIEWVNKRKIRAKDSVNVVWWLSKTPWPKANISRVLAPYSERMKKLIENPEKFYTPKLRPSGHDVSLSFGKDNGGAIPSNLLQLPNTDSSGRYLSLCKAMGVAPHPARFPSKLPEFFIRFLTDPGDLVIDIFAGSNTTGEVAEAEGRRWIAMDERLDYLAASSFRFVEDDISDVQVRQILEAILSGVSVDLRSRDQVRLFA